MNGNRNRDIDRIHLGSETVLDEISSVFQEKILEMLKRPTEEGIPEPGIIAEDLDSFCRYLIDLSRDHPEEIQGAIEKAFKRLEVSGEGKGRRETFFSTNVSSPSLKLGNRCPAEIENLNDDKKIWILLKVRNLFSFLCMIFPPFSETREPVPGRKNKSYPEIKLNKENV